MTIRSLLLPSLRSFIALSSPRASFTLSTMSPPQGGIPLPNVLKVLNDFADLKLAESWDNVGLLVEPTSPTNVHTILMTNDLTEPVMEDAIRKGANLIISYHPPIFAPLKRITTSSWKERVIAKCLENRVAVFSPHTSWDAVYGGVTDWLIGAFGLPSSAVPITPSTVVTEEGSHSHHGAGRILTLNKPVNLVECVELVKKTTGIPYVRLAMATSATEESEVKTIAFVCGSGASLLRGVRCDLYVTGEMLHHDILDANHNGSSVILTNHSDSERGFLKVMSKKLEEAFNGSLKIIVSDVDRDPLVTV